MALIKVNGKRVRKPGTCYNHACVPVPGHTLCQVCLDVLKVKYLKRRGEVKYRLCLRCNRKQKKKWKGRMCSYCRRTLRKNPDAEIRKTHKNE
jgi:hypothetical protein